MNLVNKSINLYFKDFASILKNIILLNFYMCSSFKIYFIFDIKANIKRTQFIVYKNTPSEILAAYSPMRIINEGRKKKRMQNNFSFSPAPPSNMKTRAPLPNVRVRIIQIKLLKHFYYCLNHILFVI